MPTCHEQSGTNNSPHRFSSQKFSEEVPDGVTASSVDRHQPPRYVHQLSFQVGYSSCRRALFPATDPHPSAHLLAQLVMLPCQKFQFRYDVDILKVSI